MFQDVCKGDGGGEAIQGKDGHRARHLHEGGHDTGTKNKFMFFLLIILRFLLITLLALGSVHLHQSSKITQL